MQRPTKHLFQLCSILISMLVLQAQHSILVDGSPVMNTTKEINIPDELLQSFGAYPNVLQLTEDDRINFHPVLKFPKNQAISYMDCREAKGLASVQKMQKAARWSLVTWIFRPFRMWLHRGTFTKRFSSQNHFSIGRYDEDRQAMYSSDHFQNTENDIDGYAGRRTVHLGIDLAGPVGSKVFAFEDGIVHSVGYNAVFGDYGYVIVIEHLLPSGVPVWALYGHLDKSTLKQNKAGNRIRKGQVLGRLGNCHENGGWEEPHVHFQIAIKKPETHDMPGACSLQDRHNALLDYPDPRYIVGELY